jgi:hypothetical protein
MGLKIPAQLAPTAMAAGNGPQVAELMGTSLPTDISTTDACTSKHPVDATGFDGGPVRRETELPQRKVNVC